MIQAVCSESRIDHIHISVPVFEINKYRDNDLLERKNTNFDHSSEALKKVMQVYINFS